MTHFLKKMEIPLNVIYIQHHLSYVASFIPIKYQGRIYLPKCLVCLFVFLKINGSEDTLEQTIGFQYFHTRYSLSMELTALQTD